MRAAYIVAIKEPATAIQVVRRGIGDDDGQFEDLGRVSEPLLKMLHLSPGEFVRTDRLRQR